MAAYTFLATKRLNREHHAQLGILRLAQSEDGEAVKKQLETWEKDA